MSRPKTTEEVQKEFIGQIKCISRYWANLNVTKKEMCDGVAHSILSMLDGASALPAFDLLISPHEDDKQFDISNGDNYYEPKMMINDCMLHELFYK